MKAPALVLALLLACIGTAATSPADSKSEPSLFLRVSPLICLAPCGVMTTITIPQHPNNRWIAIQIDGPTFQGTLRQINGEDGPRVLQIPFYHLVVGDYLVTAILYRNTLPKTEAARVVQAVEVHGGESLAVSHVR